MASRRTSCDRWATRERTSSTAAAVLAVLAVEGAAVSLGVSLEVLEGPDARGVPAVSQEAQVVQVVGDQENPFPVGFQCERG